MCILYIQALDVSKYSLKTLDTAKYVAPLICRMGIALQKRIEMSEVAL